MREGEWLEREDERDKDYIMCKDFTGKIYIFNSFR